MYFRIKYHREKMAEIPTNEPDRLSGRQVKKTTFDEEQLQKDEAFLLLAPTERLRLHEEMRRRIWGTQYEKASWNGLKVTRKNLE
jgi:hypothetical protein